MALTQMLIMPLFFVSGAMFPLTGLPTWLTILNRIDPMTYAVDPIRRVVFDHLSLSPEVRHRLDPGVTWAGWHVPPLVCAAVVLALGVAMTGVAIAEFSRSDSPPRSAPAIRFVINLSTADNRGSRVDHQVRPRAATADHDGHR
jgi:ABC-2 type transport system permease protein